MKSIENRFWGRVAKADGDACWEWLACLTNGYGCFNYNKKKQGAHRVSWQLTRGPIPQDKWVLHKCDNRKCVRPDHLFLGTCLDNNRDMYAKGRGRPPVGESNWMRKVPGIQRGENNFNARLNASIVAHIKNRLLDGCRPSILAKMFNVSSPTICLIASGANWGHVPWREGAAMDINCDMAARARPARS